MLARGFKWQLQLLAPTFGFRVLTAEILKQAICSSRCGGPRFLRARLSPSFQAGWEKLEHDGVIKRVTDGVKLRERAVGQHLEALWAGKTALLIFPRHEEARKVAAVVRQQLKAEGAIGAKKNAVTVLRRMDLGREARQDPLHYAPGRDQRSLNTSHRLLTADEPSRLSNHP